MRKRPQKGCKKNKKETGISKERKLLQSRRGKNRGLEVGEEKTKETKYFEENKDRKYTKFIL